MDIYTLLVATHIIGTALGAGGAIFAEVFYLKAIKDGEVDPTEGGFLKVTYRIMRVGLVLLVLSGFGFLLLYRLQGNEELLYSQKFWAKMTIVLVILVNAILLQIRRIPMWLGSSLSLTSWYTALFLGLLQGVSYTYGQVMIFYIAAVLIVAIILEKIRRAYIQK